MDSKPAPLLEALRKNFDYLDKNGREATELICSPLLMGLVSRELTHFKGYKDVATRLKLIKVTLSSQIAKDSMRLESIKL